MIRGGDRPPGSTRRTSGYGDFEADALCQVADATVALAGDQASAAHEHAVAVLDQTAQLGGCHEAIRSAWLVAVDAALRLELFDPVEDLLEALERRPPGGPRRYCARSRRAFADYSRPPATATTRSKQTSRRR